MDWSKSKNILIIIFVILNIFLLVSVVQKESKVVVISQKDVSDIQTILKGNNIDLKATIPNKIKQKPFLKVEDIVYNESETVKKILGDDSQTVKESNNDKTAYKKGGKTLEFYKDKTINYINSAPTETVNISNKKDVIEYAKDFLKDNFFDINKGVLTEYKANNDSIELLFEQQYKDNPIFVSSMWVKISDKGILAIKGRWVTPVEFIDNPKDIKTPLEILLVFSKDYGQSTPTTIKSVTLGYYFNLKEFKNAAVSAFPVWKIETDNMKYYYNAYEGYLENKTQ